LGQVEDQSPQIQLKVEKKLLKGRQFPFKVSILFNPVGLSMGGESVETRSFLQEPGAGVFD
jgi:hypothetical protein